MTTSYKQVVCQGKRDGLLHTGTVTLIVSRYTLVPYSLVRYHNEVVRNVVRQRETLEHRHLVTHLDLIIYLPEFLNVTEILVISQDCPRIRV